MKSKEIGVYGYLRRLCLTAAFAAGLALTAGVSLGAAQTVVDPDTIAGNPEAVSQLSPFNTTVAYAVQFYPLWFTYYQSLLATPNRLAGPNRISPIYQYVVAINVDTLYASTFLDLTAQPVILKIPSTTVRYSILMLDPYGDIFDAGIPPLTAGTFALTGPGFTGTVPADVTPIAMPLDFSTLIFRADKFSQAGQDQTKEANAFRKSLETGGTKTVIVPEILLAAPFKTTADDLITIAVRDTGVGIAPEDQATIFEEFRQVGRDDARKQEGTGLGLTLAKKFVELHGGRIWVESQVGQGSTFTFTLPVRSDGRSASD